MRLLRRAILTGAAFLALTAAQTVAQDPGTPRVAHPETPLTYVVAWSSQYRTAVYVFDRPGDLRTNLRNCQTVRAATHRVELTCSLIGQTPADLDVAPPSRWINLLGTDGAPVMSWVAPDATGAAPRACERATGQEKHGGWTCRVGDPRLIQGQEKTARPEGVRVRVENRSWADVDLYLFTRQGDRLGEIRGVTAMTTRTVRIDRLAGRTVVVAVHPIGGRTYGIGAVPGTIETPQILVVNDGDLVCVDLAEYHAYSNLSLGTADRCP